MENKRKIGYKYEGLVADYLQKKGFKILQLNYTIRGGEIDIIAKKNNIIHFVEVKSSHFIEDFQNYITSKKIKALQKTAKTWILKNPGDFYYQFDLAIIENGKLTYIENFLN